ncbi:MAG TPA: PHP-associated domain-containing protein, partial [Clostridia bacterium]|nr:PHP-associated domain-containing protein [Clostridia bacterium]
MVCAHPFRLSDEPISPCCLDGVEAYNGKDSDQANARAESFAREHGLIMISGSDMHNPHEAARGGVILPARADDQHELVRLLKSNIM